MYTATTYTAIMCGCGVIELGYSLAICPTPLQHALHGPEHEMDIPRFGSSMKVHTIRVAMLMSKDSGVSTCSLYTAPLDFLKDQKVYA